MTDQSVVDRVALAIAKAAKATGLRDNAWHPDAEVQHELARKLASAAIEAMRDPTDAMLQAGGDCDEPSEYGACADAETHWRSMIDAALSPPKD